ncbi:seven-hairpin glycosidase [Ascobolus immersus RN42]|uniref:alpha-1,2-Mannosidase n=1 Tax=Ascobolus immersus RN42 TaxID=1160509 RepID=A0A3N4I9T5_ASCIM|nr:seven-hairpin glycosidase [Ascobolus immersus RN42]
MLPRLGQFRRPLLVFAFISIIGYFTFFSGPPTTRFRNYVPFKPDTPPPPPGHGHGTPPSDSVVHAPSEPIPSIPNFRPDPFRGPGVAKPAPGRLPKASKTPVHWQPSPEHYPLPSSIIISLPTTPVLKLPRVQAKFAPETPEAKKIRLERLEAVKTEVLHAYRSYRDKAFLHDEVRPISGRPNDPFGGKAATLVDSLDTLFLVGAEKEFEEAVKAVEGIDWTIWRGSIPVFESNIRYLGGLLGAYDVSGGEKGPGKVLLKKAEELAKVLMGVFDTPNRMPILHYAWEPEEVADPQRAPSRAVTAELASLSLEFTRLSQLTHNPLYYDAVHRITILLAEYQNRTLIPGLFPAIVDASGCGAPLDTVKPAPVVVDMSEEEKPEYPKDGLGEEEENRRRKLVGVELDDCPLANRKGLERPNWWYNEHYQQGGMVDSAYEYLIKNYILLGGTEPLYAEMFNFSQTVAKARLYFRPLIPGSAAADKERGFKILLPGQVVVSRGEKPRFDGKSSHLSCFVGGMVGLGARTLAMEEDVELAKGLTEGCVWAYNSTASGLMPEEFTVGVCDSDKGGSGGIGSDCGWDERAWLKEAYPHHFQNEREQLNAQAARLEDELEFGERSIEDDELVAMGTRPNKPTKVKREPEESQLDGIIGTLKKLAKRLPPPKKPVDGRSAVEKAREQAEQDGRPKGITEVNDGRYILRPEAVESVFYLHRLTADPHWAEAGWSMFQSMIRSTRAPFGHSAIQNVLISPDDKGAFRGGDANKMDSMESFWLAETLKYAFLLFSEPDVVSLDEWVLNTEAHPFKRPKAGEVLGKKV